jgi:hypothetical protein
MNDREITSSRTRLRRRGTGDRAVARLPGQPTPVRPACARACPTTSGDVRLPRLGKIRQARRLHVHRQQPDRRPRRRHHALAARLGGAGGPRRLRPTGDRLGTRAPGARLAAGPAEHGLLAHARAAAPPEAIWLFSTPIVRRAARPVSMWLGGLVFRRLYRWQVGRFFGTRGRGSVHTAALRAVHREPHCARGVPRAHHRSIAVDGPGQLLTTITAIVEAASTPPSGAAKSPSPTCTSRGRSPS